MMMYNWTKWWIVQLEPLWWVGGLCVSASPPIPCQMRSAKSHNSSSDCKGGFVGWPGAGVIYELLRLRDLPAFIAFHVIVTVCSGQYNSIKRSTSNSAFLSACLSGLGSGLFGGVCTSPPSLILCSSCYIVMCLLDCKGFCGSWSYKFCDYVHVSLAFLCKRCHTWPTIIIQLTQKVYHTDMYSLYSLFYSIDRTLLLNWSRN